MRFVLGLLILLTISSEAQSLQTIYIGQFGQSDDAARLRMLLADNLRAEGFVITENADAADATLSGALTVQVFPTHTEAHATAILVDRAGQQVWKGNYGSSWHTGNDAVKWRANDIAKALAKLRK
jgi:hypothetical protein